MFRFRNMTATPKKTVVFLCLACAILLLLPPAVNGASDGKGEFLQFLFLLRNPHAPIIE